MLDNIKLEDLKTMSFNELEKLATDIRNKIIEVTSKNGGHLSSNLGVVELTIALHKVFDSPTDKIIFDVSHQMYAHKILTGRLNEFDSLRKLDGLSGFAKYSESIHDCFEAGHSSTSISAALGFLEAKKTFNNEIGEVISVIGDASLTNGLCFEALNYLADHKEQKMIIIINDNNMSISKNTGFMAKRYNSLRIKKSVNWLKKITPIRLKHALQYYAYKVDLFTSMGFKYFENIDGHNLKDLVKYLTFAKNSPKSIVLHIKTTKGKGYLPAENDTLGIWHGVGGFDIVTGKFNKKNQGISYGEAISDELVKYMDGEQGKYVRVITPAMVLGSGISSFAEKYPEFTIDVGIAEENGLLMAASMGRAGLKPVFFVYATFLQRAYDQLIHDIARTNTHVVICVDRAGIVPDDGDTHQGIYDLAMYDSIPGLTVLHPASISDAKKMLKYALDEIEGPVIIRYPKGEAKIDINSFNNQRSWSKLIEHNNYIITYGNSVSECYQVIKDKNLNIGLIAAPIISEVDQELIKRLKPGSNLYVYEEVISKGSLGSKILEFIHSENLNINLKMVNLDNIYLTVGKIDELKKRYHVSIEDLIALIKEGK